MAAVQDTGARRMVGYEITLGAADQPVEVALTIGPQHLNRTDTLHGGLAAMLLDTASGFAASKYFGGDPLPQVVTLSLTTDFVAAPRDGTRVTARGQVDGGGRKIAYARAELTDGDGTIYARATAVLKRLSERT